MSGIDIVVEKPNNSNDLPVGSDIYSPTPTCCPPTFQNEMNGTRKVDSIELVIDFARDLCDVCPLGNGCSLELRFS